MVDFAFNTDIEARDLSEQLNALSVSSLPPPACLASWLAPKLFASEISAHLGNHRILPRFFYRSDGWFGKRCESRSIQIGRVVFRAKKGSYPLKPSNGHCLLEDDASGDY